ncbi:MAG: IclR family transcriptional regulator [Propioniciclava sp.]
MSASTTASQTLSRGLRVLEVLAAAGVPMTIDQIAEQLEVHRSIAYRLLRTLEDHALVVRNAAGHLVLGARLAALAAGVQRDLQLAATPELAAAAEDLGMTCFLAVLDADQCTTVVSVGPTSPVPTVAQRPGARHVVTKGAPGKAILTQMHPERWPSGMTPALRSEVVAARGQGFAVSRDEVIATVRAVAVPLALRGRTPATIAALCIADDPASSQIAERLTAAARAIHLDVDG